MSESANILSVSQLARKMKNVLEIQVGEVWVEGEVSNLRVQSSGHQYFTIKDASSQISCAWFKNASSVKSAPGMALSDGKKVQIFGEVSFYESRGQAQLIVRKILEKGVGDLLQRLEELKRRLAAEGLFAAESKKTVPKFPQAIGIVTSATGAVIQDICNVMKRRAPWVQLYLMPVRVQGAGAEREIARAIQLFSDPEKSGFPKVDTLIVGRGGGSLEDLWCFNEESLARAIHACKIPVISAVGHEIDFTIADFVADLRAPTPSAAAELAAPDKATIEARLDEIFRSFSRRANSFIEFKSQRVKLITRSIFSGQSERALARFVQRFDDSEQALESAAEFAFSSRAKKLESLAVRLSSIRPKVLLNQLLERTERLGKRMIFSANANIEKQSVQLAHFKQLINSLGPSLAFQRGFSIVYDEQGRAIKNADLLEVGQSVSLRFERGRAQATLGSVEKEKIDKSL